MVKVRQIIGIDDEKDTTSDLDPDPPCPETTLPFPDVVAYHVQTRQSPYSPTGNMIRHSTAKHLGCPIMSSAQSVCPAGRWLFSASGDHASHSASVQVDPDIIIIIIIISLLPCQCI